MDALKRAAVFSGVEIDAYVAMDNHFHVVCKVVRPEEPVPENLFRSRHVHVHPVEEMGYATHGGRLVRMTAGLRVGC